MVPRRSPEPRLKNQATEVTQKTIPKGSEKRNPPRKVRKGTLLHPEKGCQERRSRGVVDPGEPPPPPKHTGSTRYGIENKDAFMPC